MVLFSSAVATSPSKEFQWHHGQRSGDIAFFCLTLMILVPSELPWGLGETPSPLGLSFPPVGETALDTAQHGATLAGARSTGVFVAAFQPCWPFVAVDIIKLPLWV